MNQRVQASKNDHQIFLEFLRFREEAHFSQFIDLLRSAGATVGAVDFGPYSLISDVEYRGKKGAAVWDDGSFLVFDLKAEKIATQLVEACGGKVFW